MPVIETRIVGVSFAPDYPGCLLTARQLHSALGKLPATLVRDTTNAHDRNAVAVYLPTSTHRIGWVAAPIARRIAPVLDGGRNVEAVVFSIGFPANAPEKIGATLTLRWRS